MKPIRLVLIGAAVVVVVLLLAVAVAFTSSFQTWATRQVLAGNPAVHATVGSVDAGLKHVEVHDVRIDQNGVLLTLPAIEADLPVVAAGLSQNVKLTRLVAKGWILDLSRTTAGAGDVSPAATTPAAVAAAAKESFSGVFGGLRLPVDLSVDGVDLEGEVVLPGARGRAKIVLTGGGLGAGRDGKFNLTGDAALADEKVNKLTLHGTVLITMDTPRTITKVATNLEAAASGSQFPEGVKLTADIAAARAASGETYSAAVVAADRRLATIHAEFPTNARQLDGTWQLNVRDSDLAPFALGQPLPAFTAVGEGKFDSDASFASVHATGRLEATADRLGPLMPQLAVMGPVKVEAEFDLAQRGDVIGFQNFKAAVSGARPIATVRTLQAFTLGLRSGELKAADPAHELFDLALQGVPVAWAQPFLAEYKVSGGDLQGDLVATTRSDGLMIVARSPLTLNGLSVAQAGKPWIQNLDLTIPFTADYGPKAWQAEISGLTGRSGAGTLVQLDAKVGQLRGSAKEATAPIKATGKLSANLPALLAQPIAANTFALTSGDATIDFVASLDGKKAIQAKLAVPNLAADPKLTKEKLPAISAEVRADVAENGEIALNAPILLERNGRKSDLAIAGTARPGKDKLTLDAQVTSATLFIDDAKILTALLPATPAPVTETGRPSAGPTAAPTTAEAPPWAGVDGTLKLGLKKVVYSDAFQATDVSGTLRIEGGTLKFEKLGGVTTEGGEARLDGMVKFTLAAPQPYALDADLMMKDFDPAPLFRALNPQQPPTIEGKFNTTSHVAGAAKSLGQLPQHVAGDFQLSSRGGVYRGLPLNVTNAAETTGRVAGWIASAGTALGALTGKKEYTDYGSKAQALAELATLLRNISYDQLSVVANRDASLNVTLKDFTLISPEIRLSGGGTITPRGQADLLDDAVAMEFKLRARGHVADLLKYLGLLEAQPDDLGYAACTLPLKVAGTLGKPDTSELNSRLLSIALEKSGVGEKAGDLFNRLIGGGK